jgi:CDP-4-dehydro-6-deoxyglucose reductase
MTFTVTVLPSGVSFSVDRDEPILAAAIRQGIGLPYGCRDGACGSCKCKLVEGRVIHGTHQAKALSPAEEEAGFTLTCRAAPQTDVTLEARTVAGAGEFAVRKMPCRVTTITKPTHDVAVLQLQLPANDALQYRAGQYIEFVLRDGHRRSYSMANAPGTQSDKPIVLLASGTGFAPVKAILEHMRQKAITRPTVLYWGCRAKADLYMHDWCVEAAKTMPNLRYVPVLSEPQAQDAWTGRTGFVHLAVMADLPDLSSHQIYACGAPVMVDTAQRDFVAHCNLPLDEFYADSFTSEADKHGE